MRFHAHLQSVLMQRRSINHRYSLRSLARTLRTDHATLSQLLRGERRVTGRTIRALGPRLGLAPQQIEECRALEHEAAVLAVLDDPRFRPDSRWLAMTLNIPLDDVNITLQRLLYKRALIMSQQQGWQRTRGALMGLPVLHWQMVSRDPAASAKFYGKLFDWHIDNANALGYREVTTGNSQGIDGGIWPCPPEGQPLVQLFIEVPDVAACLQQATALGAKVIVPQSQLPDGDTLAILLDPAGLSFGLYRRREVAG